MGKQHNLMTQAMVLIDKSEIISNPTKPGYMTRHEQKMAFKAAGGNLGDFEAVGRATTVNGGSKNTVRDFVNTVGEFASYCQSECGAKSLEQIKPWMLRNYLNDKLETCTVGSVKDYASRLNKFGDALEKGLHRDFLIRKTTAEWRISLEKNGIVDDPLKPRKYNDYRSITAALCSGQDQGVTHQIAAKLMWQGGMRIECEANHIKASQLKGYGKNALGEICGKIEVCGKGHRVRMVFVGVDTYKGVQNIIREKGTFKFSQDGFRKDLRQACDKVGEKYTSAHSLRHNYAQNMMQDLTAKGYNYMAALKITSLSMGHSRIDITKHYLR